MTSSILKTAMRLILPLTLLFAGYMAIRGHNHPGGGFIGGLIAAVGLALFRMSNGPEALRRLVPMHPRLLIFTGLSLALVTSVFPLVLGFPLLRSYTASIDMGFDQPVHLASAVCFDTGVLLVVIGVSLGMITRLTEELGA